MNLSNGSFEMPADAIMIAPNTWELPDGTIIREAVINRALIGEFLASRRSGLSPRSIESYIDTFRRFTKCKPSDFNKRLDALGLGNSKLHHWRNLSVLLNWLVETGKLTRKPSLPRPHIEDKILAVVTREQMPELLSNAVSDRDRAILLLVFESGLRLREVLSIHANNIDWSNKTIKVLCKGNRWETAIFDTDTYLKPWFAEHDSFELGRSGLQTLIKRLAGNTGIHFSCHALRRSMAIDKTRRGVPTRIVMAIGHWKDEKQLTRYTKGLTTEQAFDAYRRLNGE